MFKFRFGTNNPNDGIELGIKQALFEGVRIGTGNFLAYN